jgi:transposase
MNNQLSMIQKFLIARTVLNDSVRKVAEKFGYSSNYIYEVLKYPNKNRELYEKLSAYIQSAEFPEKLSA